MFAESKCENVFEPVVAIEDIAGTKQNALNLIKNRNDEIKKTFDCFENEHDKISGFSVNNVGN